MIPPIAIRWTIVHSVTSNAELATLSNVNRQWRQVVQTVLLELAVSEPTDDRPILLLESMIRRLLQQETTEKETFCAAWFHPSGIQQLTVSTKAPLDDDESLTSQNNAHTSVSEPFAPSGGQTYEGSEEERRSSRSRVRSKRRNRSRSPASQSVRWSKPEDLLETEVVCSQEWLGLRQAVDVLAPFGYDPAFVETVLSAVEQPQESSPPPPFQTTFAVRGATIARPESYCLCLDIEKESLDKHKQASNGQEWVDIRVQEYKQSLLRRNKRRRELQREVLPRVLFPTPQVMGRGDRAVQFLNADGSHAVCMTTPKFDCGPLSQAITIFCVAIATEDGCFVSGLSHRFELGHMYPSDATAKATELSPVCVCTEGWRLVAPKDAAFHICSDDSSCDGSDNEHDSSGNQCHCVFHGVTDKLDVDDNDDADRLGARTVCRGRLGPGSWHCYAAMVDGAETKIRIDGVQEETVCQPALSGATPAMMDGLTIGSDHCFDMSLCCGYGSGGEGEGAVGEVAVFRGRLADEDITRLEQDMMQRHGIPPIAVASRSSVWAEYDWLRRAQALFVRPPERQPVAEPVPLRFMARHRSVAWKQVNAVDGLPMRIPKIGSRDNGGESSDW